MTDEATAVLIEENRLLEERIKLLEKRVSFLLDHVHQMIMVLHNPKAHWDRNTEVWEEYYLSEKLKKPTQNVVK